MPNASVVTIINQAATSNGIPPQLALAQAQQESSLNPNAYNPKSGATGLFQLEPATAAGLGVTNPLDPVQNAQGGTTYLSQLYNQFGDWATALAAFDWGPGNVQKAQAKYGSSWLNYAPAETQDYVSSILDSSGMTYTATVTPASVTGGLVDMLFQSAPADGSSFDTSDGSMLSTAPAESWIGIAILIGLGLLVVAFAE